MLTHVFYHNIEITGFMRMVSTSVHARWIHRVDLITGVSFIRLYQCSISLQKKGSLFRDTDPAVAAPSDPLQWFCEDANKNNKGRVTESTRVTQWVVVVLAGL